MWSVLVEVHFPDGTGPMGLFQMGEWRNETHAYHFARDLELMLGEHKITAHVVYSSNYIRTWMDKMARAHIHVKKPNRNFELPPCDYDE